MRRVILAVLLVSAAVSGAIDPSVAQEKKLSNDIVWMTKSIEYAALCVQTYRAAWSSVKQMAAEQNRNWVVVLDVDETVLDNSQYAVERAAIDSSFTRESWAKWVVREEAVPVPGARAFIDSVRTLGPKAHIAFITNRLHVRAEATIRNLRQFGLFKDGDTMLARVDQEDTKTKRRKCLEQGTDRCAKTGPLVILALMGDNIHDFIDVHGVEKARAYKEQLLPKDKNWGTRFFMLPNPNYGSWERDYN